MGKRKVGALEKVDADLSSLQYKIRKDPGSYKEEFVKQYSQYEAQREIFLQVPSSATNAGIISFRDLIDFVSHIAECYPEITAALPEQLIHILNIHHESLGPELREKIVTSLVLLRRKDVIDSPTLFNVLFPLLLSTHSKSLRHLLFQKVVSDLRNSNSKTTNHRLNRTVQTELRNIVASNQTSAKSIWAVRLTRELWRRQIWTDSKAVEIMKVASLTENAKAISGGVRFFLGGDKEREEMEDDSSDEDAVDIGRLKHQIGINKKTKKKSKMVENAVAAAKKKERKKKQPHPLNFSAFHLLHDPQGFAEGLFKSHLQNARSKLNLEQKLQVLQLVSRLVGLHRLTIMSLYSYFLKYLTPRQPSVTSFMASLAQAVHSQVPPDVIEPLVQKIANEFVSEAAASEVASAGLNAIREICVRQPLAMNDTLLQDLVMYRKSKDKGTMMAAKGLLSLYREVGADMLKKRDRGKEAALSFRSGERKQARFGEEVAGEIEGLELLEQWREEESQRKRTEAGHSDDREGGARIEDEEGNGEWEVDEAESDDSGGWINVHSDNDIELSDSDDEKPPTKRIKEAPAPPSTNLDTENSLEIPKEPSKSAPNLATTRILTPADLAKLRELRLQSSITSRLPSSQRKKAINKVHESRHPDDPVTAADLELASALSMRASKADKVALAKEGKTDRADHKSTQALRHEKKIAEGKSTTNKEKARKKNFLMTLGKAKKKQKHSLSERSKVLKAHVERGKKGGRRGNRNSR